MIKPEELRIGSLIYHKREVIPVTMIGEFGIQSKTQGQLINAKFRSLSLEPIPLTEDWLLKFGFKMDVKEYYHPNTMLFRLFNVTALEGGFKIIAGRKQKSIIIQISKPIDCVHQLQNLFYALTGEDLTV